jgi:hypothetical protein
MRAELRACWELASVLHFLDAFRPQLALGEEVRAEALEDALLETGCTQPLLHDVHLALLQGMHPRSSIRCWRALLAEKLAHSWRDLGDGACPFAAPAAEAVHAYDHLPAVARVRALRALCELRLDVRDLRECVDEAAGAQEAPRADFHGGHALGQDNRGSRYFYAGLDSGPRLYRERSRVGAPVKRTLVYWRRRRGREHAQRCELEYTQPGPVLLEVWELVASSGCVGGRLGCVLRSARALRCPPSPPPPHTHPMFPCDTNTQRGRGGARGGATQRQVPRHAQPAARRATR